MDTATTGQSKGGGLCFQKAYSEIEFWLVGRSERISDNAIGGLMVDIPPQFEEMTE